MEIIWAIILGVVQGITEWIPVSSSGHLVIIQQLFNLESDILFDLILHLGTLLALFIYFRKDLLNILKSIVSLNFKSPNGKLALFVIIGTIPAALIGFIFHDFFTSLFSSLKYVAIALIFNGLFLFISEKRLGNKELNFKNTFLIGLAQAISIIPGISRSGSTIGTGLLLGIKREDAGKFSFLLSIPIILGASLYEISRNSINSFSLTPLLIGFITSFIFGFLTLKILMKMIKEKKFHYFSYYCIIVGLILLLFI